MSKINTEYTQYATCPWCGYEDLDSWELEKDEYECGLCKKLFVVVRDVDVSYSTYKPESMGKINFSSGSGSGSGDGSG